MSRRVWHPLEDLPPEPLRFGHKAVTLALAGRAGAPVLPGWVLAADTQETPERAVAELLHLAPETDEWLLRSSSPLEDRAGASAAGLFRSEAATAHPTVLATALRAVLESAHEASLPRWWRERGTDLAVLAQPLRCFDAWATIELREEELRLEGWQLLDSTRSWSWEGRREALEAGAATEGMRQLLERVATASDLPRLLEVGVEATKAWLLQARPAPSRAPTARPPTHAASNEVFPSLSGWGLHVHPGDEARRYRVDHEHGALPLAPLLAGIFGNWIAASPDHTASRLKGGIWHDPQKADPTGPPPPPSPGELDSLRQRQIALGRRLREVAVAAQACRRHPDRARAEAFFARWLDFQGRYFGHSLRGVRRWARSVAPPQGALEGTAAARRRRRWRELGRRLESDRPQLPPTADALGGWMEQARDDRLAQMLRAERARCTHLCAYPYDGFGTFWGEDPTPLWREIQRSRGLKDPGPDPTVPDDPASEILRLGEDDNERLMGSYWLLRRVLHALAPALQCQRGTELLELLPSDLFDGLASRSAEETARARSRGRALYLQWRGALAGDDAPGGPRIRGRCAAEGRARGPIWVGRTLDELGFATAAPPIAVVTVVTPGDAIYFDRIAGLVCEGGDRLGHASILAREYGVPCIVQVGRVSRRLAGVHRALLDADAGELLPQTQHGSDIDHGGRS